MPDKDPGRIRAMFDRVAPRYDLLNRLMSLGRDRRWRRITAVRALGESPEGLILDLACGTGDLLLDLASVKRPFHRLAGADLSYPMLDIAAGKVVDAGTSAPLIQADGRRLPLRDRSLAGITIAFGLRNFPDPAEGLREMARVLMPGGVLAVLEFTADRGRWTDLVYRPWARWVIPLLGRFLSGDPEAYRYLPESVSAYQRATDVWHAIQNAGLEGIEERAFTGGVCRLFLARRR